MCWTLPRDSSGSPKPASPRFSRSALREPMISRTGACVTLGDITFNRQPHRDDRTVRSGRFSSTNGWHRFLDRATCRIEAQHSFTDDIVSGTQRLQLIAPFAQIATDDPSTATSPLSITDMDIRIEQTPMRAHGQRGASASRAMIHQDFWTYPTENLSNIRSIHLLYAIDQGQTNSTNLLILLYTLGHHRT